MADMAQWYKDYIGAWNSHDFGKIAPFFTPDCSYQDMAFGSTFQGIKEIENLVKTTFVMSSDIKFEMKSFFNLGNCAAGEWVMSGTHTGDVPGMKATGKKFSIQCSAIMELSEGKIKRNTSYYNFSALLMQIGWLPGAPANWMGRLMMRFMTKRQ
jgi:steroid delta-isomerase-like uncharacterized protein